jgi:hypothetical protein
VFSWASSKLRQPVRAVVLGSEQLGQLVTERCQAAWFGDDHGDGPADPRVEHRQELTESSFGPIEHAEVVQRASTAGPIGGNHNTLALPAEGGDEITAYVWSKCIRKGVWPKYNSCG